MARHDDISFIERHVDKGVLLLSLILLVYALGQWVWHSPRKIDGARPDQIDPALAKKAKDLKDGMDEVKPVRTPTPPYTTDIANLRQGSSFEPMVDLVVGRPPIDGVGPRPPKRPGLTLEQVKSVMPAPQEPLARAGYRVLYKDPKNLADVPGAHVGLFYPWRQLKKNWMHAFRNTRIKPHVAALGVRAQVQEVLGNGKFGLERDLVTVACPEVGPDGQPIQVPELPPYNGQNADEINQIIIQLEKPPVQGLILRPNYWPILHVATQKPVDWRNNLPKTLWPAAKEPLAQQLEQERVLIWFHDDGLASRKSYRYRTQLLMLNPLLTQDKLVDPKKLQDARIAALATPWSPWSEPVCIPKTTSFLLTGSSPGSSPPYVTVTVFARALGKRVSKRFKVSPGQPIGGPDKVADFTTGEIVVDLNFKREVYRGPVRTETPEMLYLDDNGLLRSRIYAVDRAKFDKMNRLTKPAPGALKAAGPAAIREEMFEGIITHGTPVRTPARTPTPRPGGPEP
ncbi:MAG: hypothetical protein ISS78_06430 [Phycisphaerae bacterium]|nr:hypothetical protein [Phycisphaerae bacterium]